MEIGPARSWSATPPLVTTAGTHDGRQEDYRSRWRSKDTAMISHRLSQQPIGSAVKVLPALRDFLRRPQLLIRF